MLKKLFAIVCMAIAVWACSDTSGESLVVPEENTTQTEPLSGIPHINWGWNGVDNGYFASYPFRTDAAREYDGSSGYSYNYSSNYHYFKIGARLQLIE